MKWRSKRTSNVAITTRNSSGCGTEGATNTDVMEKPKETPIVVVKNNSGTEKAVDPKGTPQVVDDKKNTRKPEDATEKPKRTPDKVDMNITSYADVGQSKETQKVDEKDLICYQDKGKPKEASGRRLKRRRHRRPPRTPPQSIPRHRPSTNAPIHSAGACTFCPARSLPAGSASDCEATIGNGKLEKKASSSHGSKRRACVRVASSKAAVSLCSTSMAGPPHPEIRASESPPVWPSGVAVSGEAEHRR
ncbi:hypothetical protein PR202_ga02123 [Eleusine coracana subsp. coracana]|uniref:Uncharacterized protein n=1 Tax=Eleusine coracana subsp. coracana TaxID=191504 RepID=A0AAV5BIM5_ELECO|nr:hypothetical protein PR202_ga01436 [Eleusine coracana subsp. coracana]GJM86279.1 hypothetical protein PR202_ga02123 [Eleusine coracana subsp. coracana]